MGHSQTIKTENIRSKDHSRFIRVRYIYIERLVGFGLFIIYF